MQITQLTYLPHIFAIHQEFPRSTVTVVYSWWMKPSGGIHLLTFWFPEAVLWQRQVPYFKTLSHVNYVEPGLYREHFKFVARQKARARDKGGLGRTHIYVSKCSQKRPGSV